MAVTNNDLYNPEQALQRLREQEQILNALIDSQVCLQLMIAHNIITRDEVAEMRDKVRNSSKYKDTFESISREKVAFETAQNDSYAYLKALLNAKLNGDIK